MAQIRHQIQVRKPLSHSIKGNGGGTIVNAEWGKITGTITDQIDLIQYINEEIEDINIPTNLSELVNDEGFITSSALQPYAKKTEIPTKVSDLTNDSGFIDSSALTDYALKSEIPTVPTKTSDLTNDSGFITNADIPTKTSDLTNDSGFITSSDVPTKTSDLTNDSGFIDSSALTDYAQKSDLNDYVEIDSLTSINVSEFVNDAGYLTSVDMSDYALKSEIPTSTTQLTNDSGYITSSALNDYALKSEIPTVPTNVSDFNNDAGYITDSALNDYVEIDSLTSINVSTFVNDAGYLTSVSVPTKTSDLTNDSGYITKNVNNLTYYLTSSNIYNNFYDNTQVYTKSEVDALVGGGGSGRTRWGSIDGIIDDQIDLVNYIFNITSLGYYLNAYETRNITNLTYYLTSNYIYQNYYDKSLVYTKSEVDALVQGGGGGIVSWGNIVGWINSQTDLINISSLTNYYTKTDSDARYLTSSSLTSINISTFNNDSGYITSSVTNLTNYYKKTETYTKSEVDALVQGGGGGGGGASTWGSITGTITNQTDLVNYIDGIVGDIDSILQTI